VQGEESKIHNPTFEKNVLLLVFYKNSIKILYIQAVKIFTRRSYTRRNHLVVRVAVHTSSLDFSMLTLCLQLNQQCWYLLTTAKLVFECRQMSSIVPKTVCRC